MHDCFHLNEGDRHHVLGIYFISNTRRRFCETWRLFGMGRYSFQCFEASSSSYLVYFRVADFQKKVSQAGLNLSNQQFFRRSNNEVLIQ